jgi:CPA1 family monovalent cation:H+ antiporter
MPGAGAVLFFVALLVCGLFLEPAARRARMPVSVPLVLLGFAASECATRLGGLDLGIRWYNLGTFISYLLVPALVFESALRLDTGALRRDWLPITLLTLPLMLAAAVLTAAIAYHGIGNAAGFPWIAALLAGVMLVSTEMTGMFRLLLDAGAPPRVAWILEGESIFNDTAALVLFMLVLSLATMAERELPPAAGIAAMSLRLFAGGIAVGCACGLVARWIVRRLPGPRAFALLSLAAAWVVFLLAQDVLGVSGAMAVLCAALFMWADARDPRRDGFVQELWRFLAQTAGALVFILAGVVVTVDMFVDQWLAMLIGAAAVPAARAVIVFGVLGPSSRLPGQTPLGFGEQVLLTWGSVRGSVTLALALSLPLTLDYWYTLQSLVYGAVLFSLFVQAPTVVRLAGWLRPAPRRSHGQDELRGRLHAGRDP